MSLGDGQVWDESNPQQSTLVNQGPLYETDFKVAVRSRMALEHNWPTSQSATGSGGQHTYISFQGQTAAPIMPLINATTQAGMLFTLTNGTLTYQNSAGQTKTLITSSGGVDIIGAYYSSTGILGELVVGATSGGNLAILAPAATGGMYLASTTANPGVVWLSGPTVGTFNSRSAGTTYSETAAGWVVGFTSSTQANHQYIVRQDANASPSTVIQQDIRVWAAGGPAISCPVSFPVHPGYYYSVTISGCPGATLFFVPNQ